MVMIIKIFKQVNIFSAKSSIINKRPVEVTAIEFGVCIYRPTRSLSFPLVHSSHLNHTDQSRLSLLVVQRILQETRSSIHLHFVSILRVLRLSSSGISECPLGILGSGIFAFRVSSSFFHCSCRFLKLKLNRHHHSHQKPQILRITLK